GVTQYLIIALRRQRQITVAFGVAAAFNLIANLLLTPRLSYIAAAALTVATEVVILLPFLRILRAEQIELSLPALAWRPAAAALLMGGAMLAISPLGGDIAWLRAALAALVGAPAYIAALWLLGAFGTEERALARRVLGRSQGR